MSHKNLDCSGRFRGKTVAFRVSDEEAQLIDVLVAASNMTKQDYIVAKLLDREIIVKPNISLYYKLKSLFEELNNELRRLESVSEGGLELWEGIDALSKEFVALRGDEALKEEKAADAQLKREDAPIREESRVPKAERTAHQIINRMHVGRDAKDGGSYE